MFYFRVKISEEMNVKLLELQLVSDTFAKWIEKVPLGKLVTQPLVTCLIEFLPSDRFNSRNTPSYVVTSLILTVSSAGLHVLKYSVKESGYRITHWILSKMKFLKISNFIS